MLFSMQSFNLWPCDGWRPGGATPPGIAPLPPQTGYRLMRTTTPATASRPPAKLRRIKVIAIFSSPKQKLRWWSLTNPIMILTH